MIDNPDVTIFDLMVHIPGPWLSYCGFLLIVQPGIYSAYTTGRGKIYLRARCHFENIGDSSRQAIITTEITLSGQQSTVAGENCRTG